MGWSVIYKRTFVNTNSYYLKQATYLHLDTAISGHIQYVSYIGTHVLISRTSIATQFIFVFENLRTSVRKYHMGLLFSGTGTPSLSETSTHRLTHYFTCRRTCVRKYVHSIWTYSTFQWSGIYDHAFVISCCGDCFRILQHPFCHKLLCVNTLYMTVIC